MIATRSAECGGLGMAGGDRRIVEEAEAHRRGALGMMAGRAHGDETIVHLAAHHLVDRPAGATCSVDRGFERTGSHCRVGIELHQPLGGRGGFEPFDIAFRMDTQNRRARAGRRTGADEVLEPLLLENMLDRPDAVGPFRMARPHIVAERGGMGENECRQLSPRSRKDPAEFGVGQTACPCPARTSLSASWKPKNGPRGLLRSQPVSLFRHTPFLVKEGVRKLTLW